MGTRPVSVLHVRGQECTIWQFKQLLLVHACPCPPIPRAQPLCWRPRSQKHPRSSKPLTPISENLSPRRHLPPSKISDSIKLFEFQAPEVTPMWGAGMGSEARRLIDCKLLKLCSFRMVTVVRSCASIVA